MQKRIISTIMLTLLITSMIACTISPITVKAAGSDGSSTDWWATFRHSMNHTGYSTSNISTPLGRMSYHITDAEVKSSPAIANGYVYACSLNGYVHALRYKPSGLTWTTSNQQFGQILSSPAVADGKVYFGSNDGNITALNEKSVTLNWTIKTGNAVKSSPVLADGVLYVGSCDGYLYALDASTGSELWKYYVASPIESSPAVFGNTIFFGTNDSRIYALERSGRIIWYNKAEGPIVSSPAVAEDRVYVGSCDNRTYAFNATTGNQIWNHTNRGPVLSSPAAAYGKVYFGSNDGNVTALNAADGTLVWSFNTTSPVTSSPAIADGKLFVGAGSNMHVLNAADGSWIWGYSTGNTIASSPAIADGLVAFGSDDYFIYVLTSNKPPHAVIAFSPQKPIVAQQVTFDGSQSYDPDSPSGDKIEEYLWNFGDNATDSGMTVSHAYWAAGTYNVTLFVRDGYNENDTSWQLVTIYEGWPMFHHDLTHSGSSSSYAPKSNITLWSPLRVGNNVTGLDIYMYPSPAVAGEVVFMSSTSLASGAIYAVNSDGTIKWSNTTLPSIHSSPAFIDGVVYVGSDNGYLFAFNATDGTSKFSAKVSEPNRICSSPTASGDNILVGSEDGKVYSIDKNTGVVTANSTDIGTIDSSPAVADGMVFVGTYTTNKIYALYEAGLGIRWQNSTGGQIVSSPAVAYGTVFIGSRDGKLYAFNESTGNMKWSYTTGGAVDSSPAVADGVVFVGSSDGNLYALNATSASAELLWKNPIGQIGWSSPAVANGKVFIGSKNGKVYALDIKENGAEVWSYQTNGSAESSPAILNGALYVGSQDGYLYAFGGEFHDVAVLNVTSTPSTVIQGYPVDINVTLKNHGTFNESSINVTASCDNTLLYNESISLNRDDQTTVNFTWETTGFPLGDYTISANAILEGDKDPDNVFIDGVVTIRAAIHDIAVTNVSTSKTDCTPFPVICQNCSARVNVTIENPGDYTENFNVTLYANTTFIESANITLTSGNRTVHTFNWTTTGFAKGSYNLTAVANNVDNETNTLDNKKYTDDLTQVTMAGDINGDRLVDIQDIYSVARAFGSAEPPLPSPPGHEWNPNCDINDDGIINVIDDYYVKYRYGNEDP